MLRDLLERKGLYALNSPGERMDIVDLWPLALAQSPAAGFNRIPDRLFRHFFTALIPTPTKAVLLSIFDRLIGERYSYPFGVHGVL